MKNEITFKNYENGLKVAQMLLDEGNVVLLSYEEGLLVINWEWSERDADRNDVVFMRRDEYEEELDKIVNGIYDGIAEDVKSGYTIESILGYRF